MTNNSGSSKIIGIDLGTTNSVMAIMEAGEAFVIPNSEGERTTPSVVAYTSEGDVLVGQVAKRQAVLNPRNTFYSVKRFIGRKTDEVTEELRRVPYKVVQTNDVIKLDCPALGKQLAIEEVSAQILRKLANDASEYLGETITQAVITVPAYFNDSQRQATKDAGRIAGLKVLRIVNEPTAASLSYGLDNKQSEMVLVFDLGGGTFDVSVLETGEGVFEVLATSGDTSLGGDDFDDKIVQWLIEEFMDQEGIDLTDNEQALQRFTEAAEQAKVKLSTLDETSLSLPFLLMTPDGGSKHLYTDLSREKFEEISADLIDRCQKPMEVALKDSKLEAHQIDENVLVGGSTRIPAVQRLVEDFFGKPPNQTVNPDEVVALGAAIQGGILGGEVRNVVLLDVTPLSLGIETLGGVVAKIVPRNTTVPTSNSQIFSTASDNQIEVEVNILQGEREFAADNKSLGILKLEGIPPAPSGVPQIEVTFDINTDGILSVTARDTATNKKQSITISGASTLSKDEVNRIVREAAENAEGDKEKVDQVALKNKGKTLLANGQKRLETLNNMDGPKGKEAEEKIAELKDLVARLKLAVWSDSYDTIKEVNEAMEVFFSKDLDSENNG